MFQQNLCAKTDNVFFPISEVRKGTVSLCVQIDSQLEAWFCQTIGNGSFTMGKEDKLFAEYLALGKSVF